MAFGNLLQHYKTHFKQDFMASIVVFLVALPLCLGISIATGYPPAAGLVSGIIGGLVVGLFTGCSLQVSGPAAGLITIIWEAHHTLGFEGLGIAILLAGLLQIGMGVFGLGLWFRAVSPAVIQGMLAGIGVLIFSSQFHVMVDDTPKASSLDNILTIPQAIQKGIFPLDGSVHHLAASIGLATIATILLWNMVPKKLKIIPAPLVAVIIATILANLFALPINYVAVPENLLDSLHMVQFNSDTLALLGTPDIWVTILTIGFIASAETLLTATAVDQMVAQRGDMPHRTQYNKEVIAQGIGNSLAGILGVLPITGVIVRSSANVQAGGKTNASTLMHGLWILFFVLLIPFVLETIPVAALAAILVYTGYKLVNVQAIKKLATYSKTEVFIYAATVIGIVMTNLLEGVLIGLGLSLLKHFYSHAQLQVHTNNDASQNQTHISLAGSASFVTLPKLATQLEALPEGKNICVHMEALSFIDHACMEFLQQWEDRYEQQGGTVNIKWDEITNHINPAQRALPQADPNNPQKPQTVAY